MRYQSPLIVVSDVERSKAFYKRYLGLDVAADFGANVTLTRGAFSDRPRYGVKRKTAIHSGRRFGKGTGK
jgi:catechol 2,3-dioxygenase-like lactoylglutathione lyase family enzyme